MSEQGMGALLKELGLWNIRDRGDEVWASCPSHKDSGDSWSINRRTNLHRCFACSYSGNLSQLVLDLRKDISNWEATDLIERFGVRPTQDALLDEAESRISAPRRSGPRKSTLFVSEYVLKDFPEPPQGMLDQRCVTAESALAYGVRWNPRRDAWIFPIRTPKGVLLGWQEKGPDTFRNLPAEMEKSVTVFGADRLVHVKELVIVESPIDAVVCHSLGFEAVATFGAAISHMQMQVCLSIADSFIFALDNDTEGIENTARLLTGKAWNLRGREKKGTAWGTVLPSKVINYAGTNGKDIGEITQHDPADAKRSVKEAVPFLEWFQVVPRRNRPPVKNRWAKKEAHAYRP